MPISSTENRKIFTGNGVTTVFPFPYYFLTDEDLIVIQTETASGAEVVLVLNSDYTVAGAGDEDGGSITTTAAPTSAFKLTVYRDPIATQEVDFVDNDQLPAASLERPVDKLTMIVQRLKEIFTRSLRLSDGDVSGADLTLPTLQAGKYFRVNDTGTAVELADLVVPTGAVVSATTAVEGISERATQVEVDAGVAVAPHITPQTLANSALVGRVTAAETDIDSLQAFNASDNIVINGGFNIYQRGATTGAIDDTYVIDRWNLLTQTASVNVARQSNQENGTPYSFRITQAQATPQRVGLEQIVLSENCRFLRGRNVVAGARVRSSVAQTVRYAILEWIGTANTVTSDVVNDWTSASYTAGNFFLASNVSISVLGSQAVAANTWTDLAPITAQASSSLQNHILLIWSESPMAQNETLDFARIQLSAGTVLPVFKYEDTIITFKRCCNFFNSSFGNNVEPRQNIGSNPSGEGAGPQVVAASTAAGFSIAFANEMWKAPTTLTLYNPFATNAQVRNVTRSTDCASTATTTIGGYGFYVTFTTPSGSSAGDRLAVHWTADSEL